MDLPGGTAEALRQKVAWNTGTFKEVKVNPHSWRLESKQKYNTEKHRRSRQGLKPIGLGRLCHKC